MVIVVVFVLLYVLILLDPNVWGKSFIFIISFICEFVKAFGIFFTSFFSIFSETLLLIFVSGYCSNPNCWILLEPKVSGRLSFTLTSIFFNSAGFIFSTWVVLIVVVVLVSCCCGI